jgi:hypothetical protein
MVENEDFSQHIYGQIVLKAWKEPAFKKKLLDNPREALKEMGINIPLDVKLDVHLQSSEHLHFIIPEKPPQLGELSAEEMIKTVGGRMAGADWAPYHH